MTEPPPRFDPPEPPEFGGPERPYAPPPSGPRTAGNATWSLVLGIAGLLFFPLILSIPAIVLGARARREIEADPGLGGRTQATWGYWLGIAGTVLSVLGLVLLVLGDIKLAHR